MKRLVPLALAVLLLAGCAGQNLDPAEAAYKACRDGVTPQLPVPESVVWPDDPSTVVNGSGYIIVADVEGQDEDGSKITDRVTCTVELAAGGWQLSWTLSQN